MHRVLALLLCLSAAAPAAAQTWRAVYDLHIGGLRALQAEVTFTLDGPRYRVEVHSRTRGIAAWFAHSEQRTVVEGEWQGDTPRPLAYRVDGHVRGQRRLVDMVFDPEGRPVLRAVLPSNSSEAREEIPPDRALGAVDALTAVVGLTRIITATNRCEAETRLYDARRLSRVVVRTAAAAEVVPNDWGTGLQGRGLRCEIESRLLAGFRLDEDPARPPEPVKLTAWVATLREDAPPLPLRIELAPRWWGSAHATLVRLDRLPR
ncbi:MAG: DUF3108 domain-containing protein [Rhodovarius sp.]|nr:DUF3108 domain-containing protein [Rhodovarius sp.]MCX7932438.1 DUF3108 domain-containing protein [Rhodovarius sp.]MDW8313734.1 DUF3108 domain-containing protein [Rhodovarius sp.]